MKWLALFIPTLAFVTGCDNNPSDNNAPLQSPEWFVTGEDQQYLFSTSLGLQYSPDGNLVYAFSKGNSSIGRSLGVWSLNAQGETISLAEYDDPRLAMPTDNGTTTMMVTPSLAGRLLSFADNELLLLGLNGGFYHLDQTGALINEFTLQDTGYYKLKLVAQNEYQICMVGRNNSVAALLCMDVDGSVLWQTPLELPEGNSVLPSLVATFQDDGTLVTAMLSEGSLNLYGYDSAGAVQWSQQQSLGSAQSRVESTMIQADTHLVVALREQLDDGTNAFNVLQFSHDGVYENSFNIAAEGAVDRIQFRLLPYDNNGYLLLTQRERENVYFGKNVADLQMYSFAGQRQWIQDINLDRLGVERDRVNGLEIVVNNAVISVLQNRQSLLLYTPVVIPVGVARFVDNLFISEFDGQGKLVRENVIGRLRYMVDYEGGIYQVNEFGFYPHLMATDGVNYFVAGSDIIPPTDGPAVFGARHALGRFTLEP